MYANLPPCIIHTLFYLCSFIENLLLFGTKKLENFQLHESLTFESLALKWKHRSSTAYKWNENISLLAREFYFCCKGKLNIEIFRNTKCEVDEAA